MPTIIPSNPAPQPHPVGMMTSNVRNQSIAHLAFKAGGQPFCKSRRAHIVCSADDASKWGTICKRCAAKAAKRAEASARSRTRAEAA